MRSLATRLSKLNPQGLQEGEGSRVFEMKKILNIVLYLSFSLSTLAGVNTGNTGFRFGVEVKLSSKHPSNELILSEVSTKKLPVLFKDRILKDFQRTAVYYSDELITFRDLRDRLKGDIKDDDGLTESLERLQHLYADDYLDAPLAALTFSDHVIYFSKVVSKMSQKEQIGLVLHEQAHRMGDTFGSKSLDERFAHGWGNTFADYLLGHTHEADFYEVLHQNGIATHTNADNGELCGEHDCFPNERSIGSDKFESILSLVLRPQDLLMYGAIDVFNYLTVLNKKMFEEYPPINSMPQKKIVIKNTSLSQEEIDAFNQTLKSFKASGESLVVNFKVVFTKTFLQDEFDIRRTYDIRSIEFASVFDPNTAEEILGDYWNCFERSGFRDNNSSLVAQIGPSGRVLRDSFVKALRFLKNTWDHSELLRYQSCGRSKESPKERLGTFGISEGRYNSIQVSEYMGTYINITLNRTTPIDDSPRKLIDIVSLEDFLIQGKGLPDINLTGSKGYKTEASYDFMKFLIFTSAGQDVYRRMLRISDRLFQKFGLGLGVHLSESSTLHYSTEISDRFTGFFCSTSPTAACWLNINFPVSFSLSHSEDMARILKSRFFGKNFIQSQGNGSYKFPERGRLSIDSNGRMSDKLLESQYYSQGRGGETRNLENVDWAFDVD